MSLDFFMDHRVVLLLGSNLGDKVQNLQQALFLLEKDAGSLAKTSKFYQTDPWGLATQPPFINQVVIIQSQLSAEQLMEVIHEIEKKLGRIRKVKWGSRTIDIDILYYDTLIIQSGELTVPHPELHNRRFTLVPLCEIDPEYVHPILQMTNQSLLEHCPDLLQVQVIHGTK